MKLLSEMSKKELKKSTKEQQKQTATQEIKEILSKDSFFDGVNIKVIFKDKKHYNLRVTYSSWIKSY